MQDKIANHLQEIYHPDAVILHGSRARGKGRPHSDWDFILLYNQPIDIKNGRESFEDQNIEYPVCILPVDDIYGQFEAKLLGAKVLYEKNTEATDILKKAEEFYARGVHWSPEKTSDHRLWLQGRINGMKDNVDNPVVFSKYFCDFYGRVFNYWYWILQHQHSQPIYIATEEISTKDPEYYGPVSALADQGTSLEEKVELSEKIGARLFG